MFSSPSQHPQPTICSSLALCTLLALAAAALDMVGAAASDGSGVSDGKLMVSRQRQTEGARIYDVCKIWDYFTPTTHFCIRKRLYNFPSHSRSCVGIFCTRPNSSFSDIYPFSGESRRAC